MTTERWEEYIETIDEVQREKGYAKVRDVAALLEVGLPTVTEMFQKLSEAGLINYEKYSGVTMTEKGQALADELRRKHGTLQQFLEILGVPEEIAYSEACNMEHTISPETLDRLTSFVEFVSFPEGVPLWLEHFQEFYETGEVSGCARECLESCVMKRKPEGDELE